MSIAAEAARGFWASVDRQKRSDEAAAIRAGERQRCIKAILSSDIDEKAKDSLVEKLKGLPK